MTAVSSRVGHPATVFYTQLQTELARVSTALSIGGAVEKHNLLAPTGYPSSKTSLQKARRQVTDLQTAVADLIDLDNRVARNPQTRAMLDSPPSLQRWPERRSSGGGADRITASAAGSSPGQGSGQGTGQDLAAVTGRLDAVSSAVSERSRQLSAATEDLLELARSNDLYKPYRPVAGERPYGAATAVRSEPEVRSLPAVRGLLGSTSTPDVRRALQTDSHSSALSEDVFRRISEEREMGPHSASLPAKRSSVCGPRPSLSGSRSSARWLSGFSGSGGDSQRGAGVPAQQAQQGPRKGAGILGSLFGRFGKSPPTGPSHPVSVTSSTESPVPSADVPSSPAASSTEDGSSLTPLRRSLSAPTCARREAIEVETARLEALAPVFNDGACSSDEAVTEGDDASGGERRSRDTMRPSAVRMRGDIQSEPPPDRDRRRRRGFALMDADDEFVTSDLAMRSSIFNQGLHQVPSSSRPRDADGC